MEKFRDIETMTKALMEQARRDDFLRNFLKPMRLKCGCIVPIIEPGGNNLMSSNESTQERIVKMEIGLSVQSRGLCVHLPDGSTFCSSNYSKEMDLAFMNAIIYMKDVEEQRLRDRVAHLNGELEEVAIDE